MSLSSSCSRYRENLRVLVEGMTRLGFRRLLAPQHAGYIITAFLFPPHPNFNFTTFHNKLGERGEARGTEMGLLGCLSRFVQSA